VKRRQPPAPPVPAGRDPRLVRYVPRDWDHVVDEGRELEPWMQRRRAWHAARAEAGVTWDPTVGAFVWPDGTPA
jgi:hypothetical protein